MDSTPGLIVFTMLVLSAFFSGIEIAFLSSNKLRIELKHKQGVLWANILSGYVKRPGSFISTVLIGNNIALVVYGSVMEGQLNEWFLNAPWAGYPLLNLAIQTVLSTILILVVAEFLPKMLFNINADSVLPVLIYPFQVMHYLLWPLVKAVTWVADQSLRLMPGGNKQKQDLLFTKVDLDHYISESVKMESEESQELDTEIFRNALDFDQVKVRECMIPRNEVVAVELNASLDELWDVFMESGHSKVLVYKETVDNIIGYVHQVDLFHEPESIKSVLIPIVIATEGMPANEMLKKFTANRKSIAVVVDEFGGTAGIVTIEDIIEEIFGEIEDEHDVELLTDEQISPTEYKLSARLEVDYLNETYDLNIPEGEYETLGGYIISRYESLPDKGETLVIDHFEFHVISLENARIGDVRLRVLES